MSISTAMDPLGKGYGFRILDRITIDCPKDQPYRDFMNEAYSGALTYTPFVSNGYSALVDLQNCGGAALDSSLMAGHVLAGIGGGHGWTDWYRRGSAFVHIQGGLYYQLSYCYLSGAIVGPMDWAWHDIKDTVDFKMAITPVKGSANLVTFRTDYRWPLYSWNEDFVNGTPWTRTVSWTVGTADVPIKVTQVPGKYYDFVKLYANVPGQFRVDIYPAMNNGQVGVAVYIDEKFDKFVPIDNAYVKSVNLTNNIK